MGRMQGNVLVCLVRSSPFNGKVGSTDGDNNGIPHVMTVGTLN